MTAIKSSKKKLWQLVIKAYSTLGSQVGVDSDYFKNTISSKVQTYVPITSATFKTNSYIFTSMN